MTDEELRTIDRRCAEALVLDVEISLEPDNLVKCMCDVDFAGSCPAGHDAVRFAIAMLRKALKEDD